ncbi:hypothetical protein PybrP1_000179 [[Pythium] brassicae (nom. inval.)]|nr:hypothetical protein PybrP1_000179 [[Pythium] brassicae (nom. inval.)]
MAPLLTAAVAAALWSASAVEALCPNACSGHGVCDRYIVCHCHEGFTGYDCSGIECPRGRAWGVITASDRAHEHAECSGRGHCDSATGACRCQQGFFGDACQFVDCPDSCMGFGKCVSMREHAQNERVSRELYDASTFRYDDAWDADMILGCECDDTYSGPNCALKRCPLGDDPLTTGQADELQLVECSTSYQQQVLSLRADAGLTKGTFILSFGKQYTRPIAFNALATVDSNGVSVASALLALTGIGAVTVARASPSPTQTDWQISYPAANAAQNAVVPRWKVLEVQQFICAADAGVFSLTFNNQTVSKIPFNADVNTFLALVAKIPAIGALDVTLAPSGTTTVCSAAGTYVTLRFTELLHRDFFGDVPAVTFSKLDAKGLVALTLGAGDGFIDDETKEVVKGVDTCRVVEQQAFECAATSGNFALTFEDGTRVSGLPFDVSAELLRAKILAAVAYIVDLDVVYSDRGAVACSVAGTTITLSFVVARTTGARGDGDLAEVLADRTNSGADGLTHISNRLKFPTAALTEVVRGVTCVPLDQTFSADPTNQIVAPVLSGGGAFTVSFRDYTSLPIAAHSPPENVKRILELLPSVQGVDVSFVGAQACETPTNVMKITFTQNFGNLPTVVVDGTLLTPGSTISAFGGGRNTQGVVSVDGTKESAVCSGRGQCEDVKLGKCVCYLGYTNSNGRGELGTSLVNRGDCGSTSRIPVSCPGELSCSGHGVCSGEPSWKCACAVGWQGGDCADRVCPVGTAWFDYPSDANVAHRLLKECSGVGSCDRSSGLCRCPRPYTGTACEWMSCGGSTSECSGNGQCLTLNDLAPLVTVKGETMGFTYGEDPNNPVTWDRNKIRSCLCDPPFFGYDCSLRECPRGDDLYSYDDVIERQLVQCIATAGSFTLSFRDEITAAITVSANEATVKSALESLSTLQEVRVAFFGTTTACSTGNSVMAIELVSELGDLPPLRGSKALLRDSVNGNGQDGSGALVVATRGTALQGQQSVSGTRELAFCSNQGTCDFATGVCSCNANFHSSDGKGGPGTVGDCGYHELKYAGGQQQQG